MIQTMARNVGKNKYRNERVNVGGVRFDSKKEYSRFQELVMLEKAGIIQDLKRQVKFEIVPKNCDERAAFYVADFVYKKADGKMIIEDVKSEMTRKLPLYILKRKLVKFRYPDYQFIES